ncbi:MAG: translation initiation factor IF-5A, partial [Candidatus Altiarchaeota archaeon]
RYIILDDVPCRILSIDHSKPGKHGGAKYRIEGAGVFDNSKHSIIKPSGQNVEVPIITKSTAQVLTVVGSNVQLMDMGSFETYELPLPDKSEFPDDLSEGMELLVMEVMGKRKIFQVKGGA